MPPGRLRPAARPGLTGSERRHEDDGNRLRRGFGRVGAASVPAAKGASGLSADGFSGQRREAVRTGLSAERHSMATIVLTFDVTEPPEPLQEFGEFRPRAPRRRKEPRSGADPVVALHLDSERRGEEGQGIG